MQWRILDDNIEIDLSYITCAEYQLFIDEKRQADENRQPDHWQDYRFPPGDSQKPITGVRASDAVEFCEWLTQQHSELGFRYRLPTVAEAEMYPAIEQQIGCWCNDRGKKVVVGIEATRWQYWHSKLTEVVVLNLNRDFNRDIYRDIYQNLYLNLKRDFELDLYRDLNRDFNRDLYQNLKRVLDRLIELQLYQNLKQVLDRDLDRHLYRHLYRDIYLNLDRDIYLNLDRDIYLSLYRDLYQDQYFYINLNQDLYRDFNKIFYKRIEFEVDEASDFLALYFPLLFFIVIYKVVSLTYQGISQNRKALQQIKLSRQQSEALSRKYQHKIDEIYPLYVYLVLLDERQAGRIPAWEGIRLVRERIES
ncbi:MAG: SUMF1/EgtB/PvdO family nonheme iron enzyme [Symploca sp. SIO1A3]|nr:SUMF1/EgtB/PvdO family nonheme iron enzyme [Symploca sp. SIO1A3]